MKYKKVNQSVIESLKNSLADNKKSFKWFFKNFIKQISDLSYKEFLIQINYYEEVTEETEIRIQTYLRS